MRRHQLNSGTQFLFLQAAPRVIVLFVCMLLAGCGSKLATDTPAPELTVEGWTNGERPDVEGKIVVVEFFATWCVPCIEDTPHLVEVYERYKDRNVVFVGITDEHASELVKIDQFAKQLKIPWPIGYGGADLKRKLGADVIPATFVIARDGTIVWNSDAMGTLDGAIRNVL